MREFNPLISEIEEAARNPNGWVYRIAGHFSFKERIPPEAIIGAWKVNSLGVIEGPFIENKKYNPLEWPADGKIH